LIGPKSGAGHRTLGFPEFIAQQTRQLAQFTAPKDDALVFTSRVGTPLRHSRRQPAGTHGTDGPQRHPRCPDLLVINGFDRNREVTDDRRELHDRQTMC
jgi:hypothetical protein